MDRTTKVFIGIIAVTLFIVGGVFAYRFVNNQIDQRAEQKLTPLATASTNGQARPTIVPNSLQSPEPIWAGGTRPNDGKPLYICGADSFGSYFILQQMQVSGKDVENGFHLGIVPFDLNDNYKITEDQRMALMQNGNWQCLLTTLESVVLKNQGVITAIVDESAGADQFWGRNIPTLNDLKGKRITFAKNSVGEYFTYYVLSIAALNPRFDVTLLPQDSVGDAVAFFNEGKADAVAGWEPDIYDAKNSGGAPLLSSSQLRIVVDTIVTSHQAIKDQPDLVQQFHNAWFSTLKAQVENFDGAAQQIAQWGNNDWTYVNTASAGADLRSWLTGVAQADLGDNATIMRDTRPILERLSIARRVWAAAGLTVPATADEQLINPNFIALAAQQPSLQPTGKPLNDTFSIAAKLDLSGIGDDQEAITLAVLPCRRFTFLPESTELTLESRRRLDDCVVPTMKQSVGLLLEVKGSSAWPGPVGKFTEKDIADFALARAQSVVNYLVSQEIDPARFSVTSVLPPEALRQTEDPTIQQEDRFVEMSLVTSGR